MRLRVGELSRADLARRLRREGIHLDTGAFTTHLHIAVRALVDDFAEAYAAYPLEDPPGIDDAYVRVVSQSRLRHPFRPLAVASTESDAMEPVPVERAFTAMETALNWSAATNDVAPMIVHSAVLERDGRALIMPAPTGSGKSTLAAALAWRGWRLLSDEMAVFSFEDGAIRPNPRPVSLKNEAIAVIAAYEPRARFSRTFHGTAKGDVAYMHPPPEAVERMHEVAVPALVVAPTFVVGAATSVTALERAECFKWLIESSLNYAAMLRPGFEVMTAVAERCGLYELTYSDLDSAVAEIGRLHEERTPAAEAFA